MPPKGESTSQNLAVLEVKNEELRVKSLVEADMPKPSGFGSEELRVKS
ncbi:MAG: hypothetical protein IJB98_03565 [Clostridia bacterium]|nr:hypothetical protein [Clostridia bacterium]